MSFTITAKKLIRPNINPKYFDILLMPKIQVCWVQIRIGLDKMRHKAGQYAIKLVAYNITYWTFICNVLELLKSNFTYDVEVLII